MTYTPIIFPELLKSRWVKVDLNNRALIEFPDTGLANLLLNGEFCGAWVDRIAQENNADYTWGGYLEDRKHLWRGYYPGPQKILPHLGIDYNVPAGTVVNAPMDCIVVDRLTDHDMENGWGGRLIVRLSKSWEGAPYLMLGHLAHADLPAVGASFKKGQPMARTGRIEENGGWFPHIHVQLCSEAYFDGYAKLGKLEDLDGYYLENGDPRLIAPDPTWLVGMETAPLQKLLAIPGAKRAGNRFERK